MIFHEKRLSRNIIPYFFSKNKKDVAKIVAKIVVRCSRDWRFKGQVLPIYVWRFKNGINAKNEEPNKMPQYGIIPLVRNCLLS